MNAFAAVETAVADREVHAHVTFARSGERTFILRQEVPYPFHVTRPFRLDPGRPALATLYLQSASGGLYRGDRLHLALEARAGAMAHVTTQAATIVHDCLGGRARQQTSVTVGEGALLALTCDPYVLLPGAALACATEVVLAPGARAIVAEAIAAHDPGARGAPFARFAASTRILSHGGRLLAADNGDIGGEAFLAKGSPLGAYRAMGTLMILGAGANTTDPARFESRLDRSGCLAGACAMPNDCGLAVRLLAADGGSLARAMDTAFGLAVEHLIGVVPARRRK